MCHSPNRFKILAMITANTDVLRINRGRNVEFLWRCGVFLGATVAARRTQHILIEIFDFLLCRQENIFEGFEQILIFGMRILEMRRQAFWCLQIFFANWTQETFQHIVVVRGAEWIRHDFGCVRSTISLNCQHESTRFIRSKT